MLAVVRGRDDTPQDTKDMMERHQPRVKPQNSAHRLAVGHVALFWGVFVFGFVFLLKED